MKVFNAYATRKSLELKDCKFLCDGSLLQGDVTPEQVTDAILSNVVQQG